MRRRGDAGRGDAGRGDAARREGVRSRSEFWGRRIASSRRRLIASPPHRVSPSPSPRLSFSPPSSPSRLRSLRCETQTIVIRHVAVSDAANRRAYRLLKRCASRLGRRVERSLDSPAANRRVQRKAATLRSYRPSSGVQLSSTNKPVSTARSIDQQLSVRIAVVLHTDVEH